MMNFFQQLFFAKLYRRIEHMSVQLDNLNAQIAALNTAVASVADHVKNDPATAELAATNAGIDTVTATLTNVVSELNALLVVPPAPVPPVA